MFFADNKENADGYVMGAPEMNCNTESHRPLHNDSDPVQPKSHDFPMDGVDKHPKRKVAAGPPPPTYKGKNYRWLTKCLPPSTTLRKSTNNVHFYTAEWNTSEAQQIHI